MTIRIVIPARYASTRLPGKPLADLKGRPMVVRVYERVAEALPSCDCIVAVDDDRVSSALDSFSVPWVMTSTDNRTGSDRIAEVCTRSCWPDSDVVVNVQGDEPFVPVDLLKGFVRSFESWGQFDMGTVSAPVIDEADLADENVVKMTVDRNGTALFFSRSPIPFKRSPAINSGSLKGFKRHVGIYAYRVSALKDIAAGDSVFIEESEKLEQLRALWMGYRVKVFDWDDVPPHGIDTPNDLRKAQDDLNFDFVKGE